MFRGKAASVVLFTWVVAAAQCHAQAFALTSSDKHVQLRKGAMLTLRTFSVPGPDSGLAVPPDRVLETTLNEKVGGKKCRPGDSVRLTLVYPVLFEIEGKQVRIPAKATIAAHVVYVAPRDREHDVSRLAIVAESIRWGENQALLPAAVVSAKVHVRKTVRPPPDNHDRSLHPTNSLAVLGRSRRSVGK